MRKLKLHEWDEIIYLILGLPMIICGLLLLFGIIYEYVKIIFSF